MSSEKEKPGKEQINQTEIPAVNPFYYYVSDKKDEPKPETKKVEAPKKIYKSKSSSSASSSPSRSRSRDKEGKRDSGQHSRKHAKGSPKKSYSRNNSRNNNTHGGNDYKDESYYKTKMCPLYDQGSCKKGTNCNYAHGEKQLRNLPNFRKTRLCIAYKNGECGKTGDSCKYAHGEAQLRRIRNQERERSRFRNNDHKGRQSNYEKQPHSNSYHGRGSHGSHSRSHDPQSSHAASHRNIPNYNNAYMISNTAYTGNPTIPLASTMGHPPPTIFSYPPHVAGSHPPPSPGSSIYPYGPYDNTFGIYGPPPSSYNPKPPHL